MEQNIIIEKAMYIVKNKDKLLNNMATIKYELFSLLNSNNSIENDENYLKIEKTLKNSDNNLSFMQNDAYYVIYALASFIDRLSIDETSKKQAKERLFKYIECLKIMDLEKQKQNNQNMNYLSKKELRMVI